MARWDGVLVSTLRRASRRSRRADDGLGSEPAAGGPCRQASPMPGAAAALRQLDALERFVAQSARTPQSQRASATTSITRGYSMTSCVRAGIQFHLAPSRAQPRNPAVLSGDYRNESAPDVPSTPEAQPCPRADQRLPGQQQHRPGRDGDGDRRLCVRGAAAVGSLGNDAAEPARFRLLMRRLQRVFSFRAPGAGAVGYRT